MRKFLTLLEKLYIAVTKWTVFTAITIVVIVAILGTMYLPKLYVDTKSTGYDRTQYTMKDPSVGFNEVMDTDADRVSAFQGIKTYVFSVIQNGSKGHGYALGQMAPGLAEKEDAVEIAAFIANKMVGERPKKFVNCTTCHGENGRGNNGMSPSLITLPIYNHQRQLVATQMKVTKKEVKENTHTPLVDFRAKRSSREIKLDHIMTNINKYALNAGQDGTSRQGLVSLIVSHNGGIVDNFMEEYLDQLSVATDKLLKYGQVQDEKEEYGVAPIQWRDFIKEFSNSFASKIRGELKKKNNHDYEQNRLADEKINKAIEAQTQLMIVGGVVGGAIVSFLLLTLILIFIRVEKNTRKEQDDDGEKKMTITEAGINEL